MVGPLKSQTRQQNLCILSHAITSRCYNEMVRARSAYQGDHNKYFLAVDKARSTIMPCFQGFHKKCHTSSFVCKAATRTQYIPRHLPQNKYLTMSNTDKIYFER